MRPTSPRTPRRAARALAGRAPLNAYWDADAAQWVSRGGDKPSDFHAWSASSKAWGDPRSQAQVLVDKWVAIRARREAMLTQSDWRSIRAADAGVALASPWLAYRQQLRDITSQGPDDVVWPVAPAQQEVGPHDDHHGALHLGISALRTAPLARVAVGPQMLLGLFYNLIATWLQLSTLRPFRVAPNTKV